MCLRAGRSLWGNPIRDKFKFLFFMLLYISDLVSFNGLS